MLNNGFELDLTAIEQQLSIIELDIKEIVDIINKVYNKMLLLDESKWRGREKEKIDKQYMPYLKKLDSETEKYLMGFVSLIRESVGLHKEIDLYNKKNASDIPNIV